MTFHPLWSPPPSTCQIARCSHVGFHVDSKNSEIYDAHLFTRELHFFQIYFCEFNDKFVYSNTHEIPYYFPRHIGSARPGRVFWHDPIVKIFLRTTAASFHQNRRIFSFQKLLHSTHSNTLICLSLFLYGIYLFMA